MSSRRSVLDESPAFDPSLHRPMMPAGRSGSLTFVNLSSASSLFSNPSPPVSGGGPPHSGGGGAMMMAPMSGGGSIGGMPPLMPNVVSPAAGHHPHHHQAQAAYPQQASPMGSWGFPPNAATSLQAPLQPAVLHQPHSQHHPHQQGMPTPMQPQPVYQPYQQQHPSMQPQAPFSLGGPPGSQGPYGHLPSPLQPTPVGGHPAAQHQQHLAYGGGGGGMHYASPPTSHSSGGSPSHSSYSSPPSSTSSSSTSSPSPSSTSTMMAGGVGFGYGGGVGVGSAGGGNGSFRLDEAQERMRQQHEQIRAEERLKQQQLHVKMLQEEQQRHLREEQERERIEAEKRKAEREALRQEEERKRLETQREQERQQEALRAEQMRIFEEVRQAQLRVQHEQELQHQRQQLEQFEQQQKVIQEQQRQQEQLRLERIRFEEEQRREEEAARLQQERVKQEEERKRQDLLRQEQLRQEQFALEQKRREEALQEKRRQEQLLLAQQEKLRREQEEVEQEKLRAEQRLNSERMQQEKERLAEEVRQQQERLRLAQEEIQREKEKMAIELMREQQRIQEERQRLQAEHEKLRQERMERERLEEESRVRHQERVRQHQEQLARQQEAIRQQQQQHVAHMRQQQEQMMRSQAQAQAQPQPQPQPQVSRTQTAPILSRRPTPQVPPVPTNASSWSPFGPSSSASSAEERPGEMKPRPRASVGSAILSRPSPHGSGTGSPNKASTLDSPFGGTSAAGGGSAIHQRPISPPNAAQQGTRHPRKPRHPGAPAPIGALPGGQEQRIQADAMASYEAYAAEIARKHRVSDRAEIMTADTMFDSSAFENKLDLYEDHNEQRSAYYDDSSDDENGFYNGNKRSETNPPQPRSGSILGVRSPQQQPAGRTLISHKTGPAATSGSAVPPKRVPKPMVALRTGPAGAPSHWEKDAGGVKAKDAPGARPLPSAPGDHNRRRSTGSAEGEDGDDDDNNNERNGGNAEKKGGLRALVKHHTGALKRSPRAPIYNDTEQQQPPPQQHPRSAGFSHLNASVDSAHALIEELQEVTGHKEEGQPRSAPLPRVVRQLPTPSHTSPPPATPPRSASKSLPPVPAKNPPTAAGRQLPPKKAPLPPVPRKALSREEAALIFQTRWRSSRVRRQYTQITLRTRVAREIYSSELVYVQSLGVTIDVFLKPLRRAAEQSKPIILSADIASVFGNLEEIYAYHLQMVSKLESRITRWNVETQIGDTFLDMKQDFIMLYSSYINHYDQALETIGRCKDLKTWRAFIQRCNQHPECGGLSLESFLILPVQRVTRYVILLRDLRQKTPENHVDYQNINAAQTYMDNICYQVNENKRSAENLKKQMDVLASLQAKMKPKDMVRDLVDQNRVFVKQVVVTLYDQDSDKRREVCLFVFNDQLLVTKGDIKKDRFQIIAKFTRDDINFRLEIMADTDDFMGQQIKNAFVLHTPRVSYLFFCISAEERNLLFEQIRSIFR